MTEESRPSVPPPSETGGRSDASVVTQFFLLPLAVVAGLTGIFFFYLALTRHPPTPADHLRTLRTGRFNQKWQAAFELSSLLRDGKGIRGDPALVRELAKAFRTSGQETASDPRVQRYLALALGNSGSAEAVPSLLEGARNKDVETRLYSLWGLARLQADAAGDMLRAGLKDKDASVRSVCAYGMGLLPSTGGSDELQGALQDPVDEVRWNAALALARRGDPGGLTILASLLDRSYLDRFPSMDAEQKVAVILSSISAIKILKTHDLDDRIQSLARSDPDRRVREAAGKRGDVESP
jgi:HEAT repeat protein